MCWGTVLVFVIPIFLVSVTLIVTVVVSSGSVVGSILTAISSVLVGETSGLGMFFLFSFSVLVAGLWAAFSMVSFFIFFVFNSVFLFLVSFVIFFVFKGDFLFMGFLWAAGKDEVFLDHLRDF